MLEQDALEQAEWNNDTLEYAELDSLLDRNICLLKERTHWNFEVQIILH